MSCNQILSHTLITIQLCTTSVCSVSQCALMAQWFKDIKWLWSEKKTHDQALNMMQWLRCSQSQVDDFNYLAMVVSNSILSQKTNTQWIYFTISRSIWNIQWINTNQLTACIKNFMWLWIRDFKTIHRHACMHDHNKEITWKEMAAPLMYYQAYSNITTRNQFSN